MQEPTAPDSKTCTEACTSPFYARVALAALLVLQVASYIPALTGDFKLNQFNPYDSAAYSCLGRSLAQGRGYTTRQEHDAYVPHSTWPPGMATMIATTMLPRDSLWGAHLTIAAIAMANTLLMWRLSRRYLHPAMALLATAAMVLSPIYDQLATVMMAEQPAMLMLLLSALCFARWRESGYAVNRWAASLAAVIGFGLLIKPLWVPMVLVYSLTAGMDSSSAVPLRRRLLRSSAVLGAGLLPWALWLVRGHFVKAPGFDGYGQIQAILTADNVGGPFVGVGYILRSAMETLRWEVPSRILDMWSGAGWALRTRYHVGLYSLEEAGIVAAMFALWVYAAVKLGHLRLIVLAVALLPLPMMAYFAGGSPRYWLHWTPFGMILVLAVLQRLLERRPFRHIPRPVLAGAMVACVAAMLALFAHDRVGRPVHGRELWGSFHDIALRARQVTPPDSLVLSPFSNGMSLLSRRSVDLTPADMDALAGKSPAGPHRPVYLVALKDREAEKTLKGPYLENLPCAAREILSNDHFRLYKLDAGTNR